MSINMFKYYVAEAYNKATYSMDYMGGKYVLSPFTVDPLNSPRDEIAEFIANSNLLDSGADSQFIDIGTISLEQGTEKADVPMDIVVFCRKHFIERIIIQRDARRQALDPLKLIDEFTGNDMRGAYGIMGLEQIKALMCKCALKIMNAYRNMPSGTEYLLYSKTLKQGFIVMVKSFDDGEREFYFKSFLPRTADRESSSRSTVVNLNLDNTQVK